jgi:uncharacterized membrane protein
MDCYFHNHVPSVAACTDCRQPICATCRDDRGLCPSCRLGERIESATVRGRLPGDVAGRRTQTAPPPPGPEADWWQQPQGQAYPPQTQPQPGVAVASVSPETRALTALGYPLWPLALLALLDPKKSPFVRRQAIQALGLNFGVYALWLGLSAIADLPVLGISAIPLLALLIPVALVASVVYGFKVWNGHDVRVPLISDWLDEREQHTGAA